MTPVFTKAEKAKLSELLSDESRWARTSFDLVRGQCFCPITAIANIATAPRLGQLVDEFKRVICPGQSIVFWNESPGRTFSDIRAAIDSLPTVD